MEMTFAESPQTARDMGTGIPRSAIIRMCRHQRDIGGHDLVPRHWLGPRQSSTIPRRTEYSAAEDGVFGRDTVERHTRPCYPSRGPDGFWALGGASNLTRRLSRRQGRLA